MRVSARTLGYGLFAIIFLSVVAIGLVGRHMISTEDEFQRQSSAISQITELTSRVSTSLGMGTPATETYYRRLFDGGGKTLSSTLATAELHGWDKLARLNRGALENLGNYEAAFERTADPRYLRNLHNQAILQLSLMIEEAGRISSAIHDAQSSRIREQIWYLGYLGAALLVIFSLSILALFRGFVTPVVETARHLREGDADNLVRIQQSAVTELQDLIQALYESRVGLENKNVELERFIYSVSHELKSPLVTISGFAGLLQHDLEQGSVERVKHDLEQINLAIATMSRLFDDLLELMRVGHVVDNPEKVSLDRLVRETVDSVYPRISDSNIEIEVLPDMPEVVADPHRLREVLQNLIENSIKFMGDQPAPLIEIGARTGDTEVLCFVRDNGSGIDPAYHDRIFGLFDRLNAQVQGTGVGLPLVRRIVERNGGRIWVESQGLGKGSTFTFSIPRHEQPN